MNYSLSSYALLVHAFYNMQKTGEHALISLIDKKNTKKQYEKSYTDFDEELLSYSINATILSLLDEDTQILSDATAEIQCLKESEQRNHFKEEYKLTFPFYEGDKITLDNLTINLPLNYSDLTKVISKTHQMANISFKDFIMRISKDEHVRNLNAELGTNLFSYKALSLLEVSIKAR